MSSTLDACHTTETACSVSVRSDPEPLFGEERRTHSPTSRGSHPFHPQAPSLTLPSQLAGPPDPEYRPLFSRLTCSADQLQQCPETDIPRFTTFGIIVFFKLNEFLSPLKSCHTFWADAVSAFKIMLSHVRNVSWLNPERGIIVSAIAKSDAL